MPHPLGIIQASWEILQHLNASDLVNSIKALREAILCTDKSSTVAEMGDSLATTDTGPKIGDCCALFRGAAVSPSSTMWLGPRPTSIPSDILIHPTVLPQFTNVTDR